MATCEHTTCPFAFTDESEQAQGYGCLPSAFDIIKMRTEHNKTWACHSDFNKPCVGAIKHLKEHNLPYHVVDDNLLNLETNWEDYCPQLGG